MMLETPVVLLMFKRERIVDIIERLRVVKPRKLYLVSDGGRTEKEQEQVDFCRKLAENAIDWECDVVKRYAESNKGVFDNIAGGAKWVFEREETAIFLEDDNLPEVSFFQYCEEMLAKYKQNPKILWVCGTNYFGDYTKTKNYEGDQSYYFTKCLLPCGWASWSSKFLKMYEDIFSGFDDRTLQRKIKKQFVSPALYRQSYGYWKEEVERIQSGKKTVSWDMQMDFSIKKHDVYGICPVKNQIKNIGVDEASIHGGSSMQDEMTRRFCGMDSYPLTFPLKHPEKVEIDKRFEKDLGAVILRPFPLRVERAINPILRRALHIPSGISTKKYIKRLLKR